MFLLSSLMKKALPFVLVLFSQFGLVANTITFNLENPSQVGPALQLKSGSTPLAVGSLIEVGYFDNSTVAFSGEWISLGTTSLSGSAAGYYRTSVTVDLSSAPGATTPLGTRLALRFYDTSDTSGSYNTVTDNSSSVWLWPIDPSSIPTTPGPPVSLLLLDSDDFMGPDPGLVWQDDAAPFITTLTAVTPAPAIISCMYSGAQFTVGASSLDASKTYVLKRGTDLLTFPTVVGMPFTGGTSHSFIDPSAPVGKVFYRVEEQ